MDISWLKDLKGSHWDGWKREYLRLVAELERGTVDRERWERSDRRKIELHAIDQTIELERIARKIAEDEQRERDSERQRRVYWARLTGRVWDQIERNWPSFIQDMYFDTDDLTKAVNGDTDAQKNVLWLAEHYGIDP